jgi:hypothetical protein
MNSSLTIPLMNQTLLSGSKMGREAGSTNLSPEDAERELWIKDARFAIEGVTQLIVGLVGFIGKSQLHATFIRRV